MVAKDFKWKKKNWVVNLSFMLFVSHVIQDPTKKGNALTFMAQTHTERRPNMLQVSDRVD